MSLERLLARGVDIGKSLKISVRDTMLARIEPSPGVTFTPVDDGILVSGKRLRCRWITDAKLRRIIR